MGVPVELVSMLGGGIFGGVMKIWANAQAYRNERDLMGMKLEASHMKFVEKARQESKESFSFTKRTIALTITFMVFAFPMIAGTFFNTDITVGWTEMSKGFSFLSLFTLGGTEHTVWKEVHGLALTPLHTHAACAVLAAYFGYSIPKR